MREVLRLRVQITAEQSAVLMSRQPGYVARLMAEVGDAVSAGDVLAEIRADELGDLMGATLAQSQAARARVARLESELASARREHARLEALDGTGAVPTQLRDLQEDRVAALEHALEEGAAHAAAMQSNHRRSRHVAAERRIRAPFSGVVVQRMVETGELVTGFPPTPLFQLVDAAQVRGYAYVPQLHAERIALELPLHLVCGGGQALAGAIEYAAATVDGRTRTIATYATYPNDDGNLRHGQACEGRLTLAEAQRPIVPRSALVEREGEQAVVFRYDPAESLVRAIPVRVGAVIEVGYPVMDGVAPGEVVVVRGTAELRDGVRVRVAGDDGTCEPEPSE